MKEVVNWEFDKITQPEICGFGALFEYLVRTVVIKNKLSGCIQFQTFNNLKKNELWCFR